MPDMDLYGWFDYAEGDTDAYEYNAMEWREMMRAIFPNGVICGRGNNLACTLVGSIVTVSTGMVAVDGRIGQTTGNKQITVDTAGSGYNRKDLIVAAADTNLRKVRLDIVKGTATTGAATLPTLTRTDLLYQLALYSVNISGSTISGLSDLRVYNISGRNIRAGTSDPAAVSLQDGEIYLKVAQQ